ncbi:MAG TPA: D-aminoacyl-tRNA deacylase [Candidatus Acidoferrales bacterium]
MRAVVQRVSRAQVRVGGDPKGAVDRGMVVLLGVGRNDSAEAAAYLAEKVANLRIFEDEQGKMNRSLVETGGEALVISQFTLYGDARKGRRPGFDRAAPPEQAEPLYEQFVRELIARGIRVSTGVFQAQMQVELVNDGPVTILLDSDRLF